MGKVRRGYPSDVSDEEWEFVVPYLLLCREDSAQREHDLREVFNGIRYVARSGCSWRLLPHDLPPWRIVYYYFMVWRREGLWQKIHDTLRERVRLKSGKNKPRLLRSSILRALKQLTTEECAVTMRARRSWDESDISWLIRWV